MIDRNTDFQPQLRPFQVEHKSLEVSSGATALSTARSAAQAMLHNHLMPQFLNSTHWKGIERPKTVGRLQYYGVRQARGQDLIPVIIIIENN